MRAALLPLLFLLVVVEARAQPAAPELAQAKALVQEAEVHYSLGEFDAAVDDFKAAYRLVQRPGILFNLGQCYLHQGRYDKATFSYRAYLRQEPEAPNRDFVEELIEQAELAEAERRVNVAAAAFSPTFSAGVTLASVGALGLAVAGAGALVFEGLLATDMGSQEQRTAMLWLEKPLVVGAAAGAFLLAAGAVIAGVDRASE